MQALKSPSWRDQLQAILDSPAYEELADQVDREYAQHTVYPAQDQIWQALELTPYPEVKAVILGQDPYHGPGQAMGLSFSVADGLKLPPSLVNIYQELEADLGIPPAQSGDLSPWARQGVLLLNSVLTVRAGQANSHRDLGWQQLTDQVIQALNHKTDPVIFILWGRQAQAKEGLIDTSRHYILKSAHPSPLSAYRGFFGSRPFSQTNQLLQASGQSPISWDLTHPK